MILLVLTLMAAPWAGAATSDADGSRAEVTAASLAAQRADIEQAPGLDEEQKNKAITNLDEAAARLGEAQRLGEQLNALQARLKEKPVAGSKILPDTAALELDLANIEPWTNTQLEVVLNERQRQLEQMRDTLTARERQLNDYLALTRNGGGELAALQQQLSDLRKSLANTDAPVEGALVARSERSRRIANARVLEARVSLRSLQQDNLNPLIELARRDRDAAQASLKTFEQHVTAYRDYYQQRRRSEAEAVMREAKDALSDAPSAIRSLQSEISDLAAEQARVIAAESRFENEAARIARLLEQVKQDQERVEQIVELGGSTAQVSALLQKRRALVPSTKSLNLEAIRYQQLLSDAGLRQLELDERLRDSVDAESRIEALIEKSTIDVDTAERDRLRSAATEAWTRYRETVLELWKDYTRYLGQLSKLEADTRNLAHEARAYRSAIDDRLLWLPSTELRPEDQPRLLVAGLNWLVSPDHLEALLRDGMALFSQLLAPTLFWLIGAVVLFGLRRPALRGLRQSAESTYKVRTDNFRATLAAAGHTAALILPGPWLLVGAGLLLGALHQAQNATLIFAAGLQGAGHALLFLSSLRQLCRPQGLAVAHLGWSPQLCTQLGRQAAWLRPFATPLGFLVVAGAVAVPSEFVRLASRVQGVEPGLLAVARVAMIAQMLLLAIAVHRIWRKNGAVVSAFAGNPERAGWASYHPVWFGPSLLIPLGLAVAAAVGYFYTAAFLTSIAAETLWFLLMLVLLRDLLLRSLYVAQRRLRFEEALRYREESLRNAATTEPRADSEQPPLEEEKINYGQLGEQVRRLVQMGYTITLLVGLWWIWADVVPAFNFLNRIELPITSSKLIDGISQDVPLTLGDMVAGLLLGGLALFAARNIPALLELTLLQRLPMSRASRYAFTTLTQYLVAMLGLVITFKALGLQWSSIQWLVAALSVGLGFGLQEIVANFISGIILLFEQPIRVGDVVTVDGTTGTVSRIRIRATTIVNWERQELVIPNKSFITGQLINWTLSDTVNRVFVTVGVSYDTDTREAMRLMSEVVADHPKILGDPAPRITFEGFGDNALTLNMRAYLSELDSRLQTITELHQSILDKFRAAGIEIAFPQRDVHIEAKQPIELLLRRASQQADAR